MVGTAPSTGMRLALDLTLERPSEFLLDAPGYPLHYWTPQETLLSHVIRLGEGDGPYPFAEPPSVGD